MVSVSYSQYSMYSACPYQYKLKYVDMLGSYTKNIYAIFGTSMHETVQHYIERMYNSTQVKADQINLLEYLTERMRVNFKSAIVKLNENIEASEDTIFPCSKQEMVEFLLDGKEILVWLSRRKNRIKYYAKKGWSLVGIEVPLEVEIKNNVNFIGYVDVVLKDNLTKKIKIIDIKTSTKGWGKFAKSDVIKNQQILLYKIFYSNKFQIPLEMVDVEFHILKRKLWEDCEFIQHRFQKHVPANGKVSTNRALSTFMDFVDIVFDEDGKRRTDIEYKKIAGRNSFNCTYCEFGQNGTKICEGPS